MELKQIYAYRITHIENIPQIISNGITHKKSKNANPNFVPIGDKSLIDTRSTKSVFVTNGNSTLDSFSTTIILGNFIPFYFGIKMPMLYVVQKGGNFVEKSVKAENIIYLACKITKLTNSNLTYYFSDGHATDNFTTFYDKSSIKKLPTLVNWNAVKASFWGGHENLDIRRQKQAEFLVLEDIPFNYIFMLGCYNEKAYKRLVNMGINQNKN
ncbi:MAG: DUF4433 domain-containing protein [Saprospiraceae bacterium]